MTRWHAVLWIAAALGTQGIPADAHDLSIAANVRGVALTVSVDPQSHAGAISSITYRGVQYIDTYDHGRELQTALSVDNLGECFNPTEAGSRSDGRGTTTSSRTLLATNRSNVLRTVTRPAFWLNPGEDYGHACSPTRAEHAAQNDTVLSAYQIARTTRFFGRKIPNLLMIEVEITYPEQRKWTSVEGMTGYLPPQFTAFYSYDAASRTLTPLTADATGGHTDTPVIVATPDGRNAIGVLSPQIRHGGWPGNYYAYFYFHGQGGTAKWSCVFANPVPAGLVLRYTCPVAIGTLDEVKAAMDRFHALSHP